MAGQRKVQHQAPFTNQTLAQIGPWTQHRRIGGDTLPTEWDEEVARLHLDKLGAHLTKITDKQAGYIDVPVDNPFRPDHYRD